MRVCYWWVILLLASSGFAVPAAQARNIATTMCSGLNAARIIEAKGSVSEGGLNGRFDRTTDLRTGRFAEHFTYALFGTGNGHDGQTSWVQDVSGGSHTLNAEFARRLAATDAWLTHRGWCRPDHDGAQLQFKSSTRRGHRWFDRWQAIPRSGAPVELEFERSTGLLRQSTEQLSQSRQIITYSDWRRIPNGVWLPYRERRDYPEDETTIDIRIARAAVAPIVAGSTFERPPIPNDHAILGGSASTIVPYEDDGRTRVYIPAYVNGRGPFTFELDSGGHLILTTETADALGLKPAGELSSSGSTGIMKAGFVRLDELRIGNAVLRSQPASVRPLWSSGSDRGQRPPRAGIIGLELFERFVVGIDRASRTVSLADPQIPAPHAGTPIALRFAEDAPLIRGEYAGHEGDFMLDIGNSGPTIIEHEWAADHGVVSSLEKGLRIDRTVYHCDALRIGPFRMRDELISYVGPTSVGSESMRAAAGIFGEPLLSRFNSTYDYSRGTIWLEQLPEVDPKPFNRSGLLLSKKPGQRLEVAGVIEGSPAASAGLKAGDKIIALNGTETARMSRVDASQMLAGEVGTILAIELEGAADGRRQVSLKLQNLLPCISPDQHSAAQ